MPHPYGSDHPESHYDDMSGKMIEFTHSDKYGLSVLTMRDDGPTNAFWAGPGPMPEALRGAGLIDPREDDDEHEQG